MTYNTAFPLSIQDDSVTIGVTTASTSTALPTSCKGWQLELNNIGNTIIYLKHGSGAQTVTVAAGYPIQPGHAKVITIPASSTQIGAIHAGTGTQSLIITPVVGS